MLEEAHYYGAAYVDPETGALVFYRREIAIAIAMSGADERAVGRTRRGQAYSAVADADDGHLDGDTVAHRQPLEGALAGALEGEVTVTIAFGSSPAEALALVRASMIAPEPASPRSPAARETPSGSPPRIPPPRATTGSRRRIGARCSSSRTLPTERPEA